MLMMGQGAERAGYNSGGYNFQTPAPVSPFNSTRAFKVVPPTGDHTLKAWTCGAILDQTTPVHKEIPLKVALKKRGFPVA